MAGETGTERGYGAWDLDIEEARMAVHAPASRQKLGPLLHRLPDEQAFQRSATMTIALDDREGPRVNVADSRPVLMVSGAAGGLILLVAVLLILACRRRAMKRRSEKIYKLKQEEKDPWTESSSSKSPGCLKLCTEGIRGSGLPIYYQRTETPQQHQHQHHQQHQHQQKEGTSTSECSSVSQKNHSNIPRPHQRPPQAPTPKMKNHIPPPLESSSGSGANRWTGNVVYISGYSPTLERRKPPGPDWETPPAAVPAAGHHMDAAYRTLPSKAKRLQQLYGSVASSADIGPCSAACDPGEISPERVDMMLLDEEMRTRSLPSWMRNKNKTRLQDASQHPLSFSHKQRNRMGNDAASVIARARTQYPSRSSQEPHIVYDVRTAL